MTASTFSYPCWMEISTLQDHMFCSFVGSTTLTTENTSNTHWLFLIANSQIVFTKGVFFTIKGNKFFTFVFIFYYNVVTTYHICIKAVHRLSISPHYIISNIYNIINRAQTYYVQLVLQPFWTFFHFAISYTQTSITATSIRIFNGNLNRQVVIIYIKSIT